MTRRSNRLLGLFLVIADMRSMTVNHSLLSTWHNYRPSGQPMAERFEKPALIQGNMRRRSRVPAIVFALLTFACATHAQLASRTPDHSVDHLGGTVVNSITHEPIGRALVLSSDNHFATMTDDRVRFAFTFAAAQQRP